MTQDTFDIELAGIKRTLKLFEVKPGLKIAILNTLGDTELVEACASEIARRLSHIPYDVLVTAESKSIPFTHAISVRTGKPYLYGTSTGINFQLDHNAAGAAFDP